MNNEQNPLKNLEEKQEKWQKKQEDAFNERMRQDEQFRHNLEMERVNRVNNSGLSQDAYSVREVLLMVNRAPDQDFYQPSLNQLGFAETIEAMGQAHRLFQRLQDKKCFISIERAGNNHLTAKGTNVRRLKKELRELKQIEQSFFEKFFRRISHGFIGINHVLSAVATLLAIVTGILGIRAAIQDQEIQNLKYDLQSLQEQNQESQEINATIDLPSS